ncbi:hypothetical protein WMY93_029599 [Mugilogobius chulae]|uniref:NACHT LRR and PYD domain-containing protein n=1 Tax=Mugilogobius chulae TaxID=88201 RepID=A0AAW0MLI4_9GOBI
MFSPTQVTLECQVTAARSPTQVTLECQVTATRSPTQVTLECQVTATRSPTQVTLECQVTAARSPTQVTLECQVTAARSPTQFVLLLSVCEELWFSGGSLDVKPGPSEDSGSELNSITDSGVSELCRFLQSPHCQLHTLRLNGCGLSSEEGCSALASALESGSSLRELHLSYNILQESVKALSRGLKSPDCRLEILRVLFMNLLLRRAQCKHKLLVFSRNNIYSFKIGRVFLSSCSLSVKSCGFLVEALMSNPVHLKTLDLTRNSIRDSGVSELCRFLQSPHCQLHTLRRLLCSGFCSGVWFLLRELDLSHNNLQESVKALSRGLKSPDCRLEILRLKMCSLSQSSCSALASALKSNPKSALRELDLDYNRMDLDPDPDLIKLLQDPDSSLKTLRGVALRHDDVSYQLLFPGMAVVSGKGCSTYRRVGKLPRPDSKSVGLAF